MNYRKAPYFAECYPKIERLLTIPTSGIAELCMQHLEFWVEEFGIDTKIVRSSELDISSKKSDLVLDLCKHFSGEQYLSGSLGKGYLDENEFAKAGITIEYQEFKHPVYPQRWGNFEPFMGIVDYWMNCGAGSLPFVKEQFNGIQS